jgi:DNA polymerase III delta prime subunit
MTYIRKIIALRKKYICENAGLELTRKTGRLII